MFYYQRNMKKNLESSYKEIDAIVKESGVEYAGYWELRYMIIKWINHDKANLQGFLKEYGVLWATGTDDEFSILVRSDGIMAGIFASNNASIGEFSSILGFLHEAKVDFHVDLTNGFDYTDITFVLKSTTK